MKRMITICICGIILVVDGMTAEDAHYKNIVEAITHFSVTLTNDVRSMDYDFMSILGEIKDIKSCNIRTNLLYKFTEQLCFVDKDAWRCEKWSGLQWKRMYLMAKAMCSVDDKNIMFKWQRYLDFLQTMKSELALYADVKHPDAYRERWMAEAKERLMEKIRKAETNKNIIIRGTVPISKERRESGAKWAYKKSIEYQIEEYKKDYFDSLVLKDDYMKLTAPEQKKLIEMVKEGLGRYPKWYREDPVEKR